MLKSVYDPLLAIMAATLADHSAEHESGGDDEIDCSGLDGVPVAPVLVDAVAGRTLRQLHLNVNNGTNANTLKCNTVSRFNHTPISEVDNIAKDATTGGFKLNATGTYFYITAAILEGNVLMAMAFRYSALSLNTAVYPKCAAISNEIRIGIIDPATDDLQDWTAFIDPGQYQLTILYLTA